MSKARHDLDRSTAFSLLLHYWPQFGMSVDDDGAQVTAFLVDWYDDSSLDMAEFTRRWLLERERRAKLAATCPFLRAVAAGDVEGAHAVALAGDDPADVGTLDVLVAMARRHLDGAPIELVVLSSDELHGHD